MNTRSRRLLDLAHQVRMCMNCDRFTEGCEPAHQNGVTAGKGFGIKSHDNRHAALCHDCHAWYDQGGKRSPCGLWSADRAQKDAMWMRAHLRTMDHYWSQGWLKVT